MERTYSTVEMAEIAEITGRQLQWWDERKYIRPPQDGHKRLYDERLALEVMITAKLRREGVTHTRIRKALARAPWKGRVRLPELQDDGPAFLILAGTATYYEPDKDGAFVRISTASCAVRIVDLDALREVLREGPVLKKPTHSYRREPMRAIRF